MMLGSLQVREAKTFKTDIFIVSIPNKAVVQKAQDPGKKKDKPTKNEVSAGLLVSEYQISRKKCLWQYNSQLVDLFSSTMELGLVLGSLVWYVSVSQLTACIKCLLDFNNRSNLFLLHQILVTFYGNIIESLLAFLRFVSNELSDVRPEFGSESSVMRSVVLPIRIISLTL